MEKAYFSFGQRQKSAEKSDSAEVKEEKQEELFVEADKKELEADLTETDVFENIGQLKHELMEFENLGERIRTTISSIEKLVPQLKERKEYLLKDTNEKRKEAEYLTQKIPKLKQHKEELLQRIEQKENQKKLLEKDIDERQKEVEYLIEEVPKLQKQEMNLLQTIKQNQEDLTQINDHIKEIVTLQKYGINSVSELIYSSQKRKQ